MCYTDGKGCEGVSDMSCEAGMWGDVRGARERWS